MCQCKPFDIFLTYFYLYDGKPLPYKAEKPPSASVFLPLCQPLSIVATAPAGASIDQSAAPLRPPHPLLNKSLSEGLRRNSKGRRVFWVLLSILRIRGLSSAFLLHSLVGKIITILQFVQPVADPFEMEVA